MIDDIQLLRFLCEHNIPFSLHHHEPIFDVKDSDKVEHIKQMLEGVLVKNLFVKSKMRFFLVTVGDETRVDLKELKKMLNLKDLSFAAPSSLMRLLGVTPGSVTPLGIINDQHHEVTVIIDKAVMESPLVNMHPLRNDQTVSITPQDLARFFQMCGHQFQCIDVPKICSGT